MDRLSMLATFPLLVVLLAACAPQDVHPDAGCEGAPACVKTLTPFPVCGTDYASYSNPGFAACACAEVLHHGECVAGEGAECGAGQACASGTSCRAELQRCVQTGTCRSSVDCPPGLPADGGTAPLRCVDARCVP